MSNELKVRRHLYEDGDPLGPASGILLGIALGAMMWTAGIVLWWILT